MLVYRIENTNTLGPYQYAPEAGQFSRGGEMSMKHCDARHAGPWSPDSGLGGINASEFCGLDTPQALLEWFYDYLVDLDAEGFHVSVYEAPTARVGRYGQTLFRLRDSKLVERMTCEELLDRI